MRQRGREPHSQFQQTFVGLLRNLSSCAVKIGPAMLQGPALLQGLSAGEFDNFECVASIVRAPEAGPGSPPSFLHLSCGSGLSCAAVSENMLSVETA